MADVGIFTRDAIQFAVAQCNEQGWIRGRRTGRIITGDRQQAETAVRVVPQLIEATVVAIIGPMR